MDRVTGSSASSLRVREAVPISHSLDCDQREGEGGKEGKRGYHLRSRQFGHVRDVRKRVLGCGVLAVGVGAGLGVVDLRVVLAGNVLLVVFHFARLGAALRFAARVSSLGRHRHDARPGRVV